MVIAIVALVATVRDAIGWAACGFGFPSRHGVSEGDGGSFELLLPGAIFLYSTVTAKEAFSTREMPPMMLLLLVVSRNLIIENRGS